MSVMVIVGYIMIMVVTIIYKSVTENALRPNGYFRNLSMAIFQEWENSNTAGIVTYFTLQIALVIIVFTNCFISQLLIDEVY